MVYKRKQPLIKLSSPKLFKPTEISDNDNDQKQFDLVQKEAELNKDDLINLLPDDALITIFEMLSCIDRLNVEAVSHRWRRLALNRSWSKFKEFSIEHLKKVVYDPRIKSSRQISLLQDKLNPGGVYYLNITWFESLFRRCSLYIQELVLTDFHCFRHRNVTLLKTLKKEFWNMDFSGKIPVTDYQERQYLKVQAVEQDYNESPCRRTSRKYKPKYTIYEDNLMYTSTISMPRLQHLSMHEVQLDSLDLQLITKKFPNLKSIDLSNLVSVS